MNHTEPSQSRHLKSILLNFTVTPGEYEVLLTALTDYWDTVNIWLGDNDLLAHHCASLLEKVKTAKKPAPISTQNTPIHKKSKMQLLDAWREYEEHANQLRDAYFALRYEHPDTAITYLKRANLSGLPDKLTDQLIQAINHDKK